MHILDINASLGRAVMQPAGLENSKGVISANYGKDPADPTWKDDAGMKRYLDFMAKYYPDGDKNSQLQHLRLFDLAAAGQVLKQCGDDLTRENVMKQATSLKSVAARPVAARHRRQHLADRLPRQQADADDEVQRRALGIVRPDHRGHRRSRLTRLSDLIRLQKTGCPAWCRASTRLQRERPMAGNQPRHQVPQNFTIAVGLRPPEHLFYQAFLRPPPRQP